MREDQTQNPLAGALVLLVAADGSMVDYTYTMPNGAFVLMAPATAGTYQLQVPHEHLVNPQPFNYDPQKPAAPVLLRTEPPPAGTRAERWAENKLDTLVSGVFGTICGLVIGLFFTWMQQRRKDRQLFKYQVGALKAERNDIKSTWTEIQKVVEEARGLGFKLDDRPDLGKRFGELLAVLKRQLKRIQPLKLDAAAVFSLKREKGLDRIHELEKSVEKLDEFSSDGAAKFPPDKNKWDAAGTAFTSFDTNPLLQNVN